ncbi:potassium channel family protein [Streptomyces fractus]|uniref:potassium channel family protein n=1 Tax=Streptomyces fractus TaxID=641806 RepID=UPI003CF24D71
MAHACEQDPSGSDDEIYLAGRTVLFPAARRRPPLRRVTHRLLLATSVLLLAAVIVYIGRDGYNDNSDGDVDFLDALYYAAVSLSTTGYGDVVPVDNAARLVNVLAITPLRIVFLMILVGTTLEVLTERSRHQLRLRRWRSHVHHHTVVIGYGAKGRHAVQTLLTHGEKKSHIVVVDPQRRVCEAATHAGLTAVQGDATRSEVLRRARVDEAGKVLVAPQRDDTAVLVTLTARQLNDRATVVAAVREEENVPLLRRSGADSVITSSGSAGRLLGTASVSPDVGTVLEDLLSYGDGLDVAQRPVHQDEIGLAPRACTDLVVSVVRERTLLHFADPGLGELRAGDHLVVIRPAAEGD